MDALEELLPLIADAGYLDTMFSLELVRSHDGVALKEIVDLSTLAGLAQSSPDPRGDGPESTVANDRETRIAGALSALQRLRCDRLRHERLMSKLRGAYLMALTAITLSALLVASIAIWWGASATGSLEAGMAIGPQLIMVVALGVLGGALASTSKIREVAELNSFRVVLTYAVIQPFVAAAFGFVAFMLLLAGVVTVGQPPGSWAVAAVVAFAAGYSEPFVLGILDRVTGAAHSSEAT